MRVVCCTDGGSLPWHWLSGAPFTVINTLLPTEKEQPPAAQKLARNSPETRQKDLPGPGGILSENHQKPRCLRVFYGKPAKTTVNDTFSTGAPAVTAGDGNYLGFLNSSEISVAFRSKSIKNHWLQRWLRQCENPWCETGDRRWLLQAKRVMDGMGRSTKWMRPSLLETTKRAHELRDMHELLIGRKEATRQQRLHTSIRKEMQCVHEHPTGLNHA